MTSLYDRNESLRTPSVGLPPALRTLLISESLPAHQAPGKLRRYEHLVAWCAQNAVQHNSYALHEAISDAGLLSRVIASFFAIPRLLRITRRGDHLWFLGLGEVHMLIIACVLAIFGRRATYDACDSWLLQQQARAAVPGARTFVPRAGAWLQGHSPHSLSISYISARDREADQTLLDRRESLIVRPDLPPTLTTLPAVPTGRVRRIVVALDLQSFHNSQGFDELLRAWQATSHVYPDVLLDIYGRNLPHIDDNNVRIRGWAESLADVYCGSTAVFVTNRLGSGVPNKLVEAIAARRPIILHRSLATLVQPGPWVFLYDDNLPETIADLLDLELEANETNYPRFA